MPKRSKTNTSDALPAPSKETILVTVRRIT